MCAWPTAEMTCPPGDAGVDRTPASAARARGRRADDVGEVERVQRGLEGVEDLAGALVVRERPLEIVQHLEVRHQARHLRVAAADVGPGERVQRLVAGAEPVAELGRPEAGQHGRVGRGLDVPLDAAVVPRLRGQREPVVARVQRLDDATRRVVHQALGLKPGLRRGEPEVDDGLRLGDVVRRRPRQPEPRGPPGRSPPLADPARLVRRRPGDVERHRLADVTVVRGRHVPDLHREGRDRRVDRRPQPLVQGSPQPRLDLAPAVVHPPTLARGRRVRRGTPRRNAGETGPIT